MEPRSYFGTASMLFAVTAVPFALLSALMGGSGSIAQGLIFGVLFGLVMAGFLKGQKTSIAFEDREPFVTKLKLALAGIGFHPETETAGFMTFKPSFQAGLLSGRISVALEGHCATIVGAKMYIAKLIKRLGPAGS